MLIFLLHCARNNKVRALWRQPVKQKTSNFCTFFYIVYDTLLRRDCYVLEYCRSVQNGTVRIRIQNRLEVEKTGHWSKSESLTPVISNSFGKKKSGATGIEKKWKTVIIALALSLKISFNAGRLRRNPTSLWIANNHAMH